MSEKYPISFRKEVEVFGLSNTIKHRAEVSLGWDLQPLENNLKLCCEVLSVAAVAEVALWIRLLAPYYVAKFAETLAGIPK